MQCMPICKVEIRTNVSFSIAFLAYLAANMETLLNMNAMSCSISLRLASLMEYLRRNI